MQSRQGKFHKYIASQLYQRNFAYHCICSRKDLSTNSQPGPMGPIYPGTCAEKNISDGRFNLRVRTNNDEISFIDRNFGRQTCHLKRDSGDYIIYRADGLPSYIFAVSIDDCFESYTEIVRGSDLLTITARQVHLSKLIKKPHPQFFHIPIITDQNGNKLSKQTHAPALKKHQAKYNLYFALQDLGQQPPRNLTYRPIWAIWDWALRHWNPSNIPKLKNIIYNH